MIKNNKKQQQQTNSTQNWHPYNLINGPTPKRL